MGLAQRDQPNYRMLAPASFERARQFAGSIIDPAERLAITSELARFTAHDPGSWMADQYADKTLTEIRDPALVQAVTQDLAEIKEAASPAGQ